MQINITLEDALKKASPQLREKMQYSVDLLRKAEPLALRYSPDGFYVEQKLRKRFKLSNKFHVFKFYGGCYLMQFC
jgi:hypothetical protein